LRAKLERAGKTLGNLDMLIAAHAISANATLVTRDKAFAQVEDLRPPVNWAVDL
jgi:tRNA(fMet)-specific endonuclease VapC